MSGRISKLTLITPLYYKKKEYTYSSALQEIMKAERGTDIFLKLHVEYKDYGADLSVKSSGKKNPLNEEEKARVEKGEEEIKRKGEEQGIKEGSYYFEQFLFIPEEKDLFTLIAPLLSQNPDINYIYIRFFKESVLETVMQAFLPIKEKNDC